MDPYPHIISVDFRHGLLTSGFPGIFLESLAGVPDALLLVRIRLLETSDVCGHLSDQLTINSAHHQLGLLVDRDVDSRRNRILNRVRETQREHDGVFPGLGAISDTDDI